MSCEEKSYKHHLNHLDSHIEDLENQLSHTNQELDELYNIVENTPNNMELGKKIRSYFFELEENNPYIYESPDGGETVYRREFGKYDTREKI